MSDMVKWGENCKNTWHLIKIFPTSKTNISWSGVFSLNFQSFWGNTLKLCFCWNLKHRAIPTCCLSLGIRHPAVLSAMGIEAAAGTCGPWHHRMSDFGSTSCSEGHCKPWIIPWLVQQGPVQEDGKDISGSKHSRCQHLALVCDNLSKIHLLHGQWFLLLFPTTLEKDGIG